MADDYGTRYTDARLRDVKRRLDEVYKQAAREIELKTQDFWRRHRVKDQIYRAQVARGQLDKEDYQAWMRGQVFQGEQWDAKAEQIARTMTDADKIAQKIINGEKQNIFATNANYIGYSLEKGAEANLGFGLYDSATVARLIRDEPDLLPAINPDKILEGEDMRWYQKTVTQSVTQGIIQGEGIQQIFERIALTCMDRGENAAMRDARTAYTGAQNAGRIEAMRQAQSLGIKVRKRWMATFDFKTRDTHRELDGQVVDVDSDFIVDGDRIAYPGDPSAEPALLYNCRCTLVYDYPEYPSSIERIDNTDGENVAAMTYKQWYEWKGGAAAEKAAKASIAPAHTLQTTMSMISSQVSFEDLINDYKSKATPKVGAITKEHGEKQSNKQHEIYIAQRIHDQIGGDIVLLDNAGNKSVRDYLWEKEKWELKKISSITSADTQTRKGIEQIKETGGNLILDFEGESILGVVDKIKERLKRSNAPDMTVIIMDHGVIVEIFRTKKK